MQIVIRAGGVGSRLWPLSRETKPKQLYALVSDKTMLQETVERVLPIAKPEDIYVSTGVVSEKEVRGQLGAILENNLIIEPARRDTAAAVGLESVIIHHRDPEAIIASIGSDHQIKDAKEFQNVLKKTEQVIKKNPNHLVVIGIKPENPDTGFGYIELGKEKEKGVYEVKSFKEKPEEKKAKEYVEAGNFLWNANNFVWKAKTVLSLFKKHAPDIYKQLMIIEKALGTPDEAKVIKEIYPKIKKEAVDYTIIEKTDKILALIGDFGWSDIGNWARLKEEFTELEEDNYIKAAEHIDVDSKNTLVYSNTKKLIATIGLENIIIVETEDSLLVCDKYRAQDVKKIVDELKKQNKKKYL
ncbi:mannose-1-phosphate guanylyltransferase [Patescibacteria group bacterium]|nr:mannose-1-phosphate guanylyltransferase [Patescibacteria group bacterium]MBU1673406.1 mannose-1-phosphate guanylyltransferase [Patescibacteria group bacterium]MBU1963310.1 mannose-1-phosphate guanylyltransferase [Patescibacteria group bacterium]